MTILRKRLEGRAKSTNSVGSITRMQFGSRQKGSPPLGPCSCVDYTSIFKHLFLNIHK